MKEAWLRLFAGVLLTLAVPAAALAQRTLYWDSVEVAAHLDGSGQLQVTETQTMVFTGDWNGGERRFTVRPPQQFWFKSLSRTGGSMTEDSRLDDVGDYALSGTTLRWRSRRPSDPPFAGTSLRYELRYALSDVLVAEDDHYLLDHDFAFAGRNGPINRFALRLTFDAAWRPLAAVNERYTAGPLPSGKSFVVRLPLAYSGDTPFAGSRRASPAGSKTASPASAVPLQQAKDMKIAAAVVLGSAALVVGWFFVREASSGRFTPIATSGIDDAWLREHILRHPAEVVGGAWDGDIGRAEVVALIARMVSEGKLETGVAGEGESASSMTLRLKVDRRTLERQERTLVDGLFFDGRTETSTALVQSHYSDEGFDPANAIRDEVQQAVEALLPGDPSPRRFRLLTPLLLVSGAGIFGVAWFVEGLKAATVVTVVAMLVVACGGWIAGFAFRSQIQWGRAAALACLTPAFLIAIGVAMLLWPGASTGRVDLPPLHALAIVTLALGFINSLVNGLKSNQPRGAIALRKTLAAGREYFASEFARAAPPVQEQWYPWMLAYGLEKQADSWSTPGADQSREQSIQHAPTHESSHSAPAPSPWSGFGGGRSGGAGASASWAASAGGFAAVVPRPSSSDSAGGSISSSDGGSSGSSSSGGGGGGGW